MVRMQFTSAYRQLQPIEKEFCDILIAELETRAVKTHRKIGDLLQELPFPTDLRAQNMLERALVRAALAERVKDIQDASDLSAYRVLKELSAIAFSNIEDYITDQSNEMLEYGFAHCTREQMSAVKKIKTEYDKQGMVKKIEVELYDKVAGLDRFMRYMGLLDGDNTHYRAETARTVSSGPRGLPTSLTQADIADAYAKML